MTTDLISRASDAMRSPSYAKIVRYRAEAPDGFRGYPFTLDRDGLMASRLRDCSSILEIGAGERFFLSSMNRFSGIYHTMDVDREQKQTYYTLDEIRDSYDGIVMREVAEHLTIEQFFAYVRKVYDLLNPAGVFVLSTPNPWSAFMWCDYSHITPWPPTDMYSILRAHGFAKVEIFRVIWPSRVPLWLRKAYWTVHSGFYSLDPAGSYVAAAYK